MSTGRSLRKLFDDALDLDGDARRQWLESLRSADPDAAARIERMLAHDAGRADPFTHSIRSLQQSMDFDADALLGQEIGGFRLERLLGEGGMGAVYLAERKGADFKQQVALKLLRGQWLDPAALARFADERRILARLHHPNIATFIHAGTSPEGRPFLAMEYIDGMPLLEYCDSVRLSVFARLGLVRSLLSALDHAHRALVVHRDIKPGNILVTPDGTPKLLDFGIARLVDPEAAAGNTVSRPLTPEYASPEQLAGEPVGTGSDLYSLGLVTYELCAGVLPWDAGTRSTAGPEATAPGTRLRQLDSARRSAIAARRGSDARRLTHTLRGDLGRVLRRCLQVDPAARHASAEALDRDLAAVLQRQPPPGLRTGRMARVAGFARRHAWPLVVALLLLVAGVALLGQTLYSEHQLQLERDRALIAASKSQQIAEFVEAMLSAVDPDRAHGMDRSLMKLVLDSAGKRAQKDLAGQPDVRSAIERTIARSYNSIGEYALAVKHFDAALKTLRSETGTRAEQVLLLTGKARALGNLGERGQARQTIRQATILAGNLPPDARARLYAASTRAGFDCDVAHFADCRRRYAHIVPLARRTLGEGDIITRESMNGLAFADAKLGDYGSSERLYRKLIADARQQYGDDDSRTLNAINGLAITCLEQKQFARAEKLLKPAVHLAEQSFGRNHPLTLNMLSNLGGAIRQQPGRNAEARPYYEQVARTSRDLYGADSMRTVIAESNLAELLRDAGQLDAAVQHARTAVAHMDQAFGVGSPYCGMVLDTLGSILAAEHKYPEAEQTLHRAWDIFDSAEGYTTDNPAVQSVVKHYVELYSAWGKSQQAAHWQARLETQ